MSWFEKTKKVTVHDFGGAVPLLEAGDIPLGKSLAVSNMIFRPGRIETRPGFAFSLTADGEQRELFSWSQGLVGGPKDWIVYLKDGTSIRLRDLASSSTIYDIATGLTGTSRVCFAPWGQRLYFAQQSATMRGVTHAKVWSGDTSATASNCFQRPLKTTEVSGVVTEPGAGIVTAGVHYLGAIFSTKEGFWTKPSPASASNLSFTPITGVAAGAQQFNLALTPASAWPSWITKMRLVMTAVANVSQYYLVPDSLTDVSAFRGLATAINALVNVDDATLRESDPADDFLGTLTQDASDNPPFSPFGCCIWGNRMVWFANYGGVDSLLISDPGNPQWLTADQHILQLPGGVTISGWFVLRGGLYVLSASGKTYAYSDNGSKPIDFSPPVEIDASIGTTSPGAVTVTGGASGYALVGAPGQGLYLFTGANYPQIPLSYYQTPIWEAINWAAIEEMKLVDYQKEKLILFRCKMLNATYRMLTWSYAEGMSPEKVKFSEWFMWENKGMPAVIHRSHYSAGQELWLGAGSLANDLAVRLKVEGYDAADSLHVDQTTIGSGTAQPPWWMQIGPFPPHSEGAIFHHLGVRLRMDGVGNIYVRPVKMMDGDWGSPPASSNASLVTLESGLPFYDVTLDDPLESPSEREQEAIFWLIGNGATVVADYGWAKISSLIHLMEPYLVRR